MWLFRHKKKPFKVTQCLFYTILFFGRPFFLTKSIADRLEIDPSDSREGKFSLADGSIIKSKVIIIKSVKVGNSTAYDVAAAVTDQSPGAGIDGLLGMSFLNNFNIRVDVANERLILETIK